MELKKVPPPLGVSPTGDSYIFLTNIRPSQQNNSHQRKYKSIYGTPFKIRSEPPYFCRKNKLAIFKYKDGEMDWAKFTRIGCKSWTCPVCSIKRALKVKYELRDIIQLNKLSVFLTLTLDPKKIPEEYKNNTHKYITKIFNHFLTILRRSSLNKGKEKLKYVWVIEFQKNGNAHMHILFNKFLPIKEIRKLWVHTGGGRMMKVEAVKTLEGISNYISDYIIKGIKGDYEKQSGFMHGQKRYAVSRSCDRPGITMKPILPRHSLHELFWELKSQNMEWIFDKLYELENDDIVIKNKP